MNLIERMFQRGQISSEEMSKLSEVRAGFINAMECGQIKTIEFVRKTFEGITAEEQTKLAEMVEVLSVGLGKEIAKQYGVDAYLAMEGLLDVSMVKNAAGKGSALSGLRKAIGSTPWLKNILPRLERPAYAAVLAGLGLSILHSAGQGLSMITSPAKEFLTKRQLRMESQRILAEILEENPELKKDDKVVEYFAAMQKYAPRTVATNKPVAESLLKKMHQWGQIDPQTMNQLVEMEGSYLQNISGRGKERGFEPMRVGDIAALTADVPGDVSGGP